MPQLVPQLSSAASNSSAASRASTSSSTARAKGNTGPSPFDSTLRDISKPKPAVPAKPMAKAAAAKPAPKTATKTKVDAKPDAKAPAPKKTDYHQGDSQPSDEQDDSGSQPKDQTPQDSSPSSDKGKSDQSKDDGTANGDAAAAAAKSTDPKSSAPVAATDPTADDASQPGKTDKPAKRDATSAAPPPTDAAALAAAAIQVQPAKPATPAPTPVAATDTPQQPGKAVKGAVTAIAGKQCEAGANPSAAAAAAALPDVVADGDSPGTGDGVASAASGSAGDSGSKTKSASDVMDKLGFAEALATQQQQQPTHEVATKAAPESANTPASQQAQFTEANHPYIVSEIQGKLLPDGGAMNLKLNPPDLGEMNVRVEVRDGVLSASFSAERDQTAKLLSHSLGDLKSSLEAQGITVERLHVTQTPKDSSSNQSQSNNQGGSPSQQKADADQKEQQRREMLQRMWKKLMKGQDPLDLMA